MARRTKRRTGRKSRRSIKRSIKRDLEKSLRKTIERSIKKSLNKFNKRIKKYKKKKTKKKKIQRGGDANSLKISIKKVFNGEKSEKINNVADLKDKVETLKREYDIKRKDKPLPIHVEEIYNALDIYYFNRFTGTEKWTSDTGLESLKTVIKEHIYAYLKGEVEGVKYNVFPSSIEDLSIMPKKYALNLQSAAATTDAEAEAAPAPAPAAPEVAEPAAAPADADSEEAARQAAAAERVKEEEKAAAAAAQKATEEEAAAAATAQREAEEAAAAAAAQKAAQEEAAVKRAAEEEAAKKAQEEAAAAAATAQREAEEAAAAAAAAAAADTQTETDTATATATETETEGSEDCNLSSNAKELVDELNKCRSRNREYEERIATLRAESQRKDAQIAKNGETIATNEARIAQLERDKADLEHQIGELRENLQASESENANLRAQIQELASQLVSAGQEIAGIKQANQRLAEENATLARERQELGDQLTAATQGRADGEGRAIRLQGMVDNLIKKSVCSLLGEVIIAIAVGRIEDINAEIDKPNKDRFIRNYREPGPVTWKRLLVSLMKLAIIRGYNLDSVLGLYGGDIDVHEINKDLGEDEKIILRFAIPELSGSEGFPDE